MRQLISRTGDRSRWRRLDRAFSEMNAVLLTIAIGLAALDVTCFVGLRISVALGATMRAQTAAWNKPMAPGSLFTPVSVWNAQ